MTKTQARWILIGCLVAAAVLISQAPRWSKDLTKPSDPTEQASLGSVDSLVGHVSRKSWGRDKSQDLEAGQSLHHLDRVLIESRSQIELSTMGYKLRVVGPGEVIFERWSPADLKSPVVMHLISGQLDMLAEGERGKVYVTKDRQMTDPKGASVVAERGLIISPLAFVGNPAVTIPTQTEAQTGTSTTVSMAGENDSEPLPGSLTNAYLDGEIAKEQEQFQRCQANSLRDHSEAKGQVVIGMTISPEGRVGDLHVMTSTIQDDKLHGCVLQIFSRLKFRPFKGAPIVRSYPLTFE